MRISVKVKWLVAVLGCAVLVGLAGLVWAQEEGVQCESLEVTLRTQTMVLPGMEEMLENMPELPAGMQVNIPGLAPTRTIEGKAVYIHPPTGRIFVTVPADLGLPNNILPLELPKPVPIIEHGGPEGPGGQPAQLQKFTIKLYWHPTTARGPRVIELDPSKMPQMPQSAPGGRPEDIERWAERMNEGEGKVATGSDSRISPKVMGQGTYTLNTGGQMPLDGFLPALKLSGLPKPDEVDLSEAIDVKWDTIPGARGFILAAMSMIDSHTMVLWISTENEPENWGLGWDYEQKTTISDDLAAGILLPGETTECIVPPDIFTGAGMVNLSVTAVGNDFFDKSSAPWLRGRIRSVATVMLGSPEGMGGMGGMGGEEEPEE